MFLLVAVSAGWLLMLSHRVEAGCVPPYDLENGVYSPVKESYDPRDIVTYTCQPGYYAQTREESESHTFRFKCQHVRRWSALDTGRRPVAPRNTDSTFAWLPECIPFKTCPRPILSDDLVIDNYRGQDSYEVTDIIHFRCRDPDLLPIGAVASSVSSTCQLSGEWTIPPPSGCVIPKLCPVNPPSAHMQHDPPVDSLQPGQALTSVCDEGYEIALPTQQRDVSEESNVEGDRDEGQVLIESESEKQKDEDDYRRYTRVCGTGGQLDGMEPVCKKFTCNKALTAIRNGRTFFLGNTTEASDGDSVYYRCPPEYRLNGDNVQHCVLYRGWIGRKPFCGLKYCITPRLERGYAVPNNNTHAPDETISFSCYRGYQLVGPKSLTCTHDNAWNSQAIPTCQPVHQRELCIDQGVPHNGYRFIRYYENSVRVQYGCESGYTLIGMERLRCRNTVGKWNGVPPICKSKYDFPKPGEEALRLLGRITEIVTEVTGPDGTVTHSPSELYILMDLSASLSNFSMQSTVNFLDPLLRELMNFPSKPNVGIIGFNDSPELLLEPTDYMDNVTAVMRLLKTKRGGTNIAAALRFIMELEEQVHEEDDTKRTILLVSDGVYNAGGNPEAEARTLQEYGYELLLLSKSLTTFSPNMMKLAANASTDVFYLHEHAFIDDNFKLSFQTDYIPCGLSSPYNKDPWMIEISWNEQRVPGVIVGTKWVMALVSTALPQNLATITVHYGSGLSLAVGVDKAKSLSSDVVLFKLVNWLQLGPDARAICLPGIIMDPTHKDYSAYTPSNLLYRRGTNGRVVYTRANRSATITDCLNETDYEFCAGELHAVGVEEELDDELEDFTDADDIITYRDGEHSQRRNHERRGEDSTTRRNQGRRVQDNSRQRNQDLSPSRSRDETHRNHERRGEGYTTRRNQRQRIPGNSRQRNRELSPGRAQDETRRRQMEHHSGVRTGRDVSGIYQNGEAFVGTAPNRWDLRDYRSVLSGLYSAERRAFVKIAALNAQVLSFTHQHKDLE